MFDKKKRGQPRSFAQIATVALDQALESMASNEDKLTAHALMANDGLMGPYLEEKVDWPLLWHNAAKRAPGLMMKP